MKTLILLCLVSVARGNSTVEYLSRFGYLEDHASTDGISSAIRLFQETYGLNVNGLLNEETLELMTRPRCGNKDDLLPFSANPYRKWNTTKVTWYMYGTNRYDSLIQQAFDLWQRHSGLEFRKVRTNPMIVLSFSGNRQHMYYAQQTTCPSDFDGPSSVLAHAFVPDLTFTQTDIHFDSEENWDYTMDLPAPGKVSFYDTAVHEIGHAIGLSHSYVNTSVMYSMYRVPSGISSFNELDLDVDDIRAVQYLYGPPTTTTPTTPAEENTTSTTTTTTTTPTTPRQPTEATLLDLCTLRQKVTTFLVVNRRLYIFYNNYVWALSLDTAYRTPEEFTRPMLITQWLPFLPSNFTRIDSLYRRPNGEIVILVGRTVYFIQFPSLNLIGIDTIDGMVGKPVRRVNAILSTNQGKTFIIADDWYVYERDECSSISTMRGIISEIFLGVPGKGLVSAFRYINGRLYFVTDSSVLEYNEFTQTLTGSVSDIFDVLNISCIRDTLVHQLHKVLRFLQ